MKAHELANELGRLIAEQTGIVAAATAKIAEYSTALKSVLPDVAIIPITPAPVDPPPDGTVALIRDDAGRLWALADDVDGDGWREVIIDGVVQVGSAATDIFVHGGEVLHVGRKGTVWANRNGGWVVVPDPRARIVQTGPAVIPIK